MPAINSSLPKVTLMQCFAHHGLRQAYSHIEVTIGCEELIVDVLDCPE